MYQRKQESLEDIRDRMTRLLEVIRDENTFVPGDVSTAIYQALYRAKESELWIHEAIILLESQNPVGKESV